MTHGATCQGVWNRQWEEDPIGDADGADRDTLVLWTQSSTSGIYVDLRLPLDSPGRSVEAARAHGILSPSPDAIAANGWYHPTSVPEDEAATAHLIEILCRQKSFAGALICEQGDTTTSGLAVSNDLQLKQLADQAEQNENCLKLCTCLWRRDLDYQPPSGGLDVGVCASQPPRPDGSMLLRETGEDASYAEGWLRLSGTDRGPFLALELVSENGLVGARKGYWVRAGNIFAYAIGRPTSVEAAKALGCNPASPELANSVGQSLCEAVRSKTASNLEQLALLASYVAVAGEIESRQWKIQYSTHPELVGCLLVAPDMETNDLCCSRRLSGDIVVGQHVEQQLRVMIRRDDGSTQPVTRTWKVLEHDDGSYP